MNSFHLMCICGSFLVGSCVIEVNPSSIADRLTEPRQLSNGRSVVASWQPTSPSSIDSSQALGLCEMALVGAPIEVPNIYVAAVLFHRCMVDNGWALDVHEEISVK